MTLRNTQTRYGTVTKIFHWLTALGILAVIPLGIIANDAAYDTAEQLAFKAQMFSIHKTVGVTLFFVALLRILWAVTQTKPAALHPDRRAESFLAELVHWLLYGSLVIVPLSGWVHHAATSGFAPIWWPFGQNLPLVPENEDLSHLAASLHLIFEKVLIGALILHVLGAVKHHVIDRDATLRRMWFGATQAGVAGAAHSNRAPALIAALAIWGVALGLGAGLGMFTAKAGPAEQTQLAEAVSDWRVQDGTLGVTIRQFGAEVTGSFEDWTAAITFDDQAAPGPLGSVQVQVAIGSLTLGSVTAQAMGADFFDATQFPTAGFDAEIQRAADGYEAVGTLTLRGATVPLTLPFALTLDGDIAQMTGRVTLDRRTFGIGSGMTDESQLGFAVDVTITLTATRATQD